MPIPFGKSWIRLWRKGNRGRREGREREGKSRKEDRKGGRNVAGRGEESYPTVMSMQPL